MNFIFSMLDSSGSPTVSGMKRRMNGLISTDAECSAGGDRK